MYCFHDWNELSMPPPTRWAFTTFSFRLEGMDSTYFVIRWVRAPLWIVTLRGERQHFLLSPSELGSRHASTHTVDLAPLFFGLYWLQHQFCWTRKKSPRQVVGLSDILPSVSNFSRTFLNNETLQIGANLTLKSIAYPLCQNPFYSCTPVYGGCHSCLLNAFSSINIVPKL